MENVSYIITTYNRPPEMLQRAMTSVVAERINDWNELIVIDDCSLYPIVIPDQIRNAFLGKLTLIRNKENRGVIGSRNLGLQCAQYDYIIFLDDDDWAFPNRSAGLLNAIEGSNHAFVAARAELWESDQSMKVIPSECEGELFPLKYLCNLAHINGIIWNRKILLDMGGLHEEIPYLGEQITLLLLLLRGHTAYQIETVVTRLQYLQSGLTNDCYRSQAMKQNLLGMINILIPEVQQGAFLEVCTQTRAYLHEIAHINIEEFLAYVNQHFNNPTMSPLPTHGTVILGQE